MKCPQEAAVLHLAKLHFGNRASWFLLFHADSLPREISLGRCEWMKCGGHPSRRSFGTFSCSRGGTALVKARKQKYGHTDRPVDWFFRVLIRDRLLFQFEARKERTGNKRMARAGLQVAPTLGWGLSLNPFNELLSLYCASVVDAPTVRAAFRSMGPSRRRDVLEAIADGLVQCVRNGFVVKDPSFNNILVRGDGGLVWVDTETKRVFSRRHAARVLDRVFHRQCASNEDHRLEWRFIRRRVFERLGYVAREGGDDHPLPHGDRITETGDSH